MSSPNSSSHHKQEDKRGGSAMKGEAASSLASGNRDEGESKQKGARSSNGGGNMSMNREQQEGDSKIQQGLKELYPVVENVFKDFGSNLSQIRTAATGLWKHYPLYTLVGAAALGFAAGMAVSSTKMSQSQDS